MCLNCGCGDATRRQRPTDITQADLRRAADGSYTTLAQVVQNVRTSLERLEAEQNGLAVRGTGDVRLKRR
jgi:hypothetical protein